MYVYVYTHIHAYVYTYIQYTPSHINAHLHKRVRPYACVSVCVRERVCRNVGLFYHISGPFCRTLPPCATLLFIWYTLSTPMKKTTRGGALKITTHQGWSFSRCLLVPTSSNWNISRRKPTQGWAVSFDKVADSKGSCIGWRRCIGCLRLQVIFCKRSTNYMAFLQKMTCKDKASYGSSPPYMQIWSGNTLW